ncbi:hypothetical protein N9M26_02870 [Alphaproteobacteria bacterium]|nr:hypothetical protein [Alphaproteobacteria bacterium]
MRFLLLQLILILFFNNASSLELFGYKLYSPLKDFSNQGSFVSIQDRIVSLNLDPDKIINSNNQVKDYTLKFTKNGKIYEVEGTNDSLSLSPIECLEMQKKFVVSFEKKNLDFFNVSSQKLDANLQSKSTWDVYLNDSINNQNIIFTFTCDYSFNNRRLSITLSDFQFMKNEDQKYDERQKEIIEEEKVKKIDTSGI